MASITLIRHGQASFGAENYDQLSELGQTQAAVLGRRMQASGSSFDLVILGSMNRHRQTAEACLAQQGTSLSDVLNEVDPGWNEYDHQNILAQYKQELGSAESTKTWVAQQKNPSAAFEQAFNGAIDQWVQTGEEDEADKGGYTETWQAYKTRIHASMNAALEQSGSHKNIGIFTSGGPIALVSQALLGIAEENIMQLNWTLVNAGLTKIVTTPARKFIASLNDHGHFDGHNSNLITYK